MDNPLLERIRASVIGDDQVVSGPFGPRRVTYADYTASGRALTFIEDYIREAVLPLYANTHTETSSTGLQTMHFREEARAIIAECVGAGPQHAVVFCGSGSTGAIDRLINVMNLRIPNDLDRRYGLSEQIPQNERPVVFIGPYEHHSNEILWRESIADVVVIREDRDGQIDLGHLEEELITHEERPLKIGSFSGASNVTGIVSNTRSVATLLHQYGALSFWDMAAAAPYTSIEMGPGDDDDDALAYMDAVFISPHKFVGGPGTPGVLVARRELFTNTVPVVPGGGTVEYVTSEMHRYVADPERREEGGTPAIVESIRAGLVFKLKRDVGIDLIRERERSFINRAIERWSDNPDIEILGNRESERLSIVSFVIRHGQRYLHHNFVGAVLNDLFGIQSRGGCACAGPYGHRLLGIDIETSHAFQREVARGCEGIKPGWTRVNFNYFISETVFGYILAAVDLVAREGWRLLPAYDFDPDTGNWKHRGSATAPIMALADISYDGGTGTPEHPTAPEGVLQGYLDEAAEILSRDHIAAPMETSAAYSTDFESLRWFALPSEDAALR